jgi:twitching motility protein PilT
MRWQSREGLLVDSLDGLPDSGFFSVPGTAALLGGSTDDPLTAAAWPPPERATDFEPVAPDQHARAADQGVAAQSAVIAPFSMAPPTALAPVALSPQIAAPLAGAPVAPFSGPVVPTPATDSPSLVGPAADASYARPTTEVTTHITGVDLTALLKTVLARGASDLHLTAGARPTIRLHGSLMPLEDLPELTPPVIHTVMYAILTQRQREKFETELELDFAYALPGQARFRVNLYRQRDSLGAAFRLIPYEIKPLDQLGVPPAVSNFAMLPRGFVLVTGPTGSGKSTTLAGIIDLANRQRRDHIMTVEDPIEFLHQHKSCLINQREIGEDTHSFTNALKHVLRQDPDIILVGEMRDLETISVALTAAETGHLVFATLHTQDAAQTIDRVIDVFPPHQQQQVRVQLAGTLQGVVCQTLCKSADGRGRVVATEVLTATPAIRNMIRDGKTHQIYSAMQAGAKHGMHTMDQHLAELIKAGRITMDAGLEKCHHVEDFNRLTGRG